MDNKNYAFEAKYYKYSTLICMLLLTAMTITYLVKTDYMENRLKELSGKVKLKNICEENSTLSN